MVVPRAALTVAEIFRRYGDTFRSQVRAALINDNYSCRMFDDVLHRSSSRVTKRLIVSYPVEGKQRSTSWRVGDAGRCAGRERINEPKCGSTSDGRVVWQDSGAPSEPPASRWVGPVRLDGRYGGQTHGEPLGVSRYWTASRTACRFCF